MMKFFPKIQLPGERGFSLLELMVVLAIIAVIAVLAMPSQTATTLKSSREQVTEAYTYMSGLQKAVEGYVRTVNDCPYNADEDLEDIGIAKPTAYSGHYTNTVTTAGELDDDGGCTITGKFKTSKVHAALQGKSLIMVLFDRESLVPKWACFTDADKTTKLMMPRVCRFSDFATAREAQQSEEEPATPTG